MRIAICDDMAVFRERIRKGIRAYNAGFEVKEYTDGSELLSETEPFDLIFLDIEMPGTDGMTTAKILRERGEDVKIVFVTSHDELVFGTFEVTPFGFFRKSQDLGKVGEVLQRAEAQILNQETVLISVDDKQVCVKTKDIVYVEAYGDGVYLYDKKGTAYEERRGTIKKWSEKLKGKGFVQVHRAYLISLPYLENYSDDGVKLKGVAETVPMSRRYAPAFKKEFFEFVGRNGR